MKKISFKKLTSLFLTSTLIFSTISASSINLIEAKGSSARPSASRSSSKPSSSKPSSSKPSSKPTSSTASSKPTTGTTKNFTKNSGGTYNKDYNSYNNQGYKRHNYRTNGFFSGSTITNALLWYTLFNSATSHNHVQASDKQKELVDNVKDSKVPVYMLEIKTKEGDTKHITVTKEQYEKVKEGDNISLKDGNLEIKKQSKIKLAQELFSLGQVSL